MEKDIKYIILEKHDILNDIKDRLISIFLFFHIFTHYNKE